MALNKVASYIKNIGKSVVYAATEDVIPSIAPTLISYKDSNAELAKTVTHAIKDYPNTYRRAKEWIKGTKIYEAGEIAASSALDDIRTGKFYNRERAEKYAGKAMGMDMSDFESDDLSSFEADLDSKSSDVKISDGEAATISAIEESTKASTVTISNALIHTSRYQAEVAKANTSIIFAQNERLFGKLNFGISAVNEGINNLVKFNTTAMATHFENSTKFYDVMTKNTQEQTAMLKELLEMKRNEYKERQKEIERIKGKSKNITFSDLVSGSGAVSIKDYFNVVGKNLKDVADDLGLGMLGIGSDDDNNPLAAMAANPLSFIPIAIANAAIGPKLKQAMQNFDKNLAGVFGTVMARMTALSKSDNEVLSLIGRIFGIKETNKTTVDPSKYVKSAIPFDGVTKKAIVEVIPTLLAKIESAITGRSEKVFDYETGKWTTTSEIERSYKALKRNNVQNAFSDVASNFDKALRGKYQITNARERAQFQEDLQKVFQGIYEDGGFFNHHTARNKYGISQENFNTIVAMWSELPKHVQLALGGNVQAAKNSLANTFKAYEESGTSLYTNLSNNRNLREYYDEDKYGNITRKAGITKGIVDKHGNDVFYYLQNLLQNADISRQALEYIANNSDMATGAGPGTRVRGLRSPFIPKPVILNTTNYRTAHQKSIEEESKRFQRLQDQIDRDLKSGKISAAEGEYRHQVLAEAMRATTKEEQDAILKQLDEENWLGRMLYGSPKELDKKSELKEMAKEKAESFRDQFTGARNLSEKWRVVKGKISELASKPSDYLTNMFNAASENIYDFLFEAPNQDSMGKRVKGFFGRMQSSMNNIFNKIVTGLDKHLFGPLGARIGDKSWKSALAKYSGWNWLKNKYGAKTKDAFKRTFGGVASGFTGALSEFVDRAVGRPGDQAGDVEYLIDRALYNNTFGGKSRQELEIDLTNSLADETQLNANGARYINKSGITTISEGEMIIPADLNPFNPNRDKANRSRAAREEEEINKQFSSQLAKIISKSIGANAVGSISVSDPAAKNLRRAQNAISGWGSRGAKAIDNLIIRNSNDQMKAIYEDLKKNNEIYVPEGLAGGALGGLFGLVTGLGPMAGIVIGAGVSIAKNSSSIKNWLFGKEVPQGGREGGALLNREQQEYLKKIMPDVKMFTAAGGLAGLLGITPFGILGGITLGAAAAYAKNNDTFMNTFFGDEDGLINADRKALLKKAFPKMAVGTLATYALGPFGLVGSAVLGSAAGIISTTDTFKNWILGDKDFRGKRTGGLVGVLRTNFADPLINFSKDIAVEMKDFLKNDIMKPLAVGVSPLLRYTGVMMANIGRASMNYVKALIRPGTIQASKYIDYYLGRPLRGFADATVGNLFRGGKWAAKKVISSPFKAIGRLGTAAQRRMIEKGQDASMSADQRIAWMQDHGITNYDMMATDLTLSGMDIDQLTKFKADLAMLEGEDLYRDALRSDEKALGVNLGEFLSPGDAKKVVSLLQSEDDFDQREAYRIIEEKGKFSSEREKQTFIRYINKTAQSLNANRMRLGHFKGSKALAVRALREKGINVDDADAIRKLKALTNAEFKAKSKFNPANTSPEQQLLVATEDGNKQITGLLQDIFDLLANGGELTDDQKRRLGRMSQYGQAKSDMARRSYTNAREAVDMQAAAMFGSNVKITGKQRKALESYKSESYQVLEKLNKAGIRVANVDKLLQISPKGADKLIELQKYIYRYGDKKMPKDLEYIEQYDANTFNLLLDFIDYGGQVDSLKTWVGKEAELKRKVMLGKTGLPLDSNLSYDQIISGVSNNRINVTGKRRSDMYKEVKDFNSNNSTDDIDFSDTTTDASGRQTKTVMTDDGPLVYIKSTDGGWSVDPGDQSSRETIAKRNARVNAQNENTKALNSVSGIFKSIFGIKDGKEESGDKKKDDKSGGMLGAIFGGLGNIFSKGAGLLRGALKVGGKIAGVGLLANYLGPHIKDIVEALVRGSVEGISLLFNLAKDTIKKTPEIASNIWQGIKEGIVGKTATEQEVFNELGLSPAIQDGKIIGYNDRFGNFYYPNTAIQMAKQKGYNLNAETGVFEKKGVWDTSAGATAFGVGMATLYAARKGYNAYQTIKGKYQRWRAGKGQDVSTAGLDDGSSAVVTQSITNTDRIVNAIMTIRGGVQGALGRANDYGVGNTYDYSAGTKKPTTKGKGTTPSQKTAAKTGIVAKVTSKLSTIASNAAKYIPFGWGKKAASVLSQLATKLGPKVAAAAPRLAAVAGTGGTLLAANAVLSVYSLITGFANAEEIFGVPGDKLSFFDRVVAGCANGLSELIFGIVSPQEIASLYTPDAVEESQTTMLASNTTSTDNLTSKGYVKGSIADRFFGGNKYGRGFFKQDDPRWAGMQFNASGDSVYQNMADSGCGPIAAVNALYGRGPASPIEAARFALRGGYKEKDGGTRPEFFSSYFNAHGKQAQYTSGQGIINNLRSGNPVVMMGQSNKIDSNTPYGTGPHYVTATGLDGRGNMIIQDPQDPRNNIRYNARQVLSKTKFGVAARGKWGRSKLAMFGMGRIPKSDDIGALIWQKFVSFGILTEVAIAGIMGNMYAESALQPRIVQGDPPTYANEIPVNGQLGYGLCQWTDASRQRGLANYAASVKKSSGDAEVQVEYVIKEMRDSYPSLIDKLNACKTPSEAAILFHRIFEVSADTPQQEQRRADYAEQIYTAKGVGVSGKLVTRNNFNGPTSTSESAMNGFIGFLAKKASKLTSIYNKIFGGDILGTSSSGSSDYSPTQYNSKSNDPAIKKATEWANSIQGQQGYGNNGCTEFTSKYLSMTGKDFGYLKRSNGEFEKYVPTLQTMAKKAGKWKSGASSGSEGDIALIETNFTDSEPDHAVIADGSGGYFGNSSSRNIVVHGNLGTDFGADNVLGYIATGDQSVSAAASGTLARTKEQIIADAGSTSAMGKFGRGKRLVSPKAFFGKGPSVTVPQNYNTNPDVITMNSKDYTDIFQKMLDALLIIAQNTTGAPAPVSNQANIQAMKADRKQAAIDRLRDGLLKMRSANGLGQVPMNANIGNLLSTMEGLATL